MNVKICLVNWQKEINPNFCSDRMGIDRYCSKFKVNLRINLNNLFQSTEIITRGFHPIHTQIINFNSLTLFLKQFLLGWVSKDFYGTWSRHSYSRRKVKNIVMEWDWFNFVLFCSFLSCELIFLAQNKFIISLRTKVIKVFSVKT
jgi:hypothetical protein